MVYYNKYKVEVCEYSQSQRDLDLKSELTNKHTSVFVVIQIHFLNYLAAELTRMALFECEQVLDL